MIQSIGDATSATSAGAAAVEVGYDMTPQRQYQVTAKDAPMWVRVVAKGEAVKVAAANGSGSHFVPQNTSLPVAMVGTKARISFCREGGTDATCVLSERPNVVNV